MRREAALGAFGHNIRPSSGPCSLEQSNEYVKSNSDISKFSDDPMGCICLKNFLMGIAKDYLNNISI